MKKILLIFLGVVLSFSGLWGSIEGITYGSYFSQKFFWSSVIGLSSIMVYIVGIILILGNTYEEPTCTLRNIDD